MRHHWIIEVLSDLRTFAQMNGLDRLADQLDDTTLIAARELAMATPLTEHIVPQHPHLSEPH